MMTRWLAVSLVSASFALAACGGDDTSGGSGGAAGSGTGGAAGSGTGGASGSGTGGGGGAAHVCADIKGSCTPQNGTCIEYGGMQDPGTFVSLEENCKQDKFTWATSQCDAAGTIGSCVFDTPNGPCNTIFYASSWTASDAEAHCGGLNGGVWAAN